jgi:hypothetical protein
MNQNTNLTQVYAGVKVVDDSLERNGQVGVYLGPAETEGESVVKFDDDQPGQHDSFANTSLQVL